MAMGECLAYSRPNGEVSVSHACILAYELVVIWYRPTFT